MIRLIHGDCIPVMQKLIDEGIKIDLTITSPPYDQIRNYNNNLKWNENIWKKIIELLYQLTDQNGCVVWVVGDGTVNGGETGTSFKQALYFMDCGFKLHDTMIYKKNSIAFPDNKRYYQCFEYMFIFKKGNIKFNPIQDRKNKKSGQKVFVSGRQKNGELLRKQSNNLIKEYGVRWNLWEYDTGWMKSYHEEYLKIHPAIFPLNLAIDHILSWSNKNDLVLDPFMGSGTTGLACRKLKRDFIGIEKEKKYFDIAVKRIKENK